jgi:membrane protease YdiL (CAAX protease family)
MAFAPEVLLYAIALGMGVSTTDTGKATVGSALALVVSSLVLYVWQTASAWTFSLRTAGNHLALWGFRRPNAAFFWTIPLALVAVYAFGVVHDIVVHPENQELLSQFPHSAGGIALFVVVAVIMAPLFEETFFRGFLFRGLATSWGWVWGALGSATVFGLAHQQLSVFLPLFALGFALAWVYKRTGSLWTSIALHSLFNAVSVFLWALGPVKH